MNETSVSNGEKRDERGRFAPGTRGGPGNPNLRQLGEYQEAVRRAVKPHDLEELLGTLVSKARDGDVLAARVVLDRVLGKPRLAEQEGGLAIELPALSTADSFVEASSRIFEEMGKGLLTPAQAVQAASIVDRARLAFETLELTARISALEGMAREGFG